MEHAWTAFQALYLCIFQYGHIFHNVAGNGDRELFLCLFQNWIDQLNQLENLAKKRFFD